MDYKANIPIYLQVIDDIKKEFLPVRLSLATSFHQPGTCRTVHGQS